MIGLILVRVEKECGGWVVHWPETYIRPLDHSLFESAKDRGKPSVVLGGIGTLQGWYRTEDEADKVELACNKWLNEQAVKRSKSHG